MTQAQTQTQTQTQTPQNQTPKWKTILELNKVWLVLDLKVTEVEGKRYVMIFADDFSDWKEYAIYNTSVDEEKIREVVERIEKVIERAENDESYDPVPEIASLVSEITDTFVIGEVPEEMGVCSEDEYIAYPHEDERLNWPLCYSRPFARPHLLLLGLYGLLPEEWIPHINQN